MGLNINNMELSIQNLILQQKQAFDENPKEFLEKKGKQRNKDYAKAVQCFVDRINKDRKKEKKEPVLFIAVMMKLRALKEVDELRTWYETCLKYSYTKDKQGKRNTFSKAFWGGTKL